MSIAIACKVKEIRPHKFTHINQIMVDFIGSYGHSHSSKSDGVVTLFPHIFINLDPCCNEWCESHVRRLYGAGDMAAQIHPRKPKS